LRVVKEAPCPVISVQSHGKSMGFKKILLPIDNSQTSRQKVPYMLELAVQSKAIVHILGLMTSSSEDFKKTFRVKIAQVEEYLANHDIAYESEFLRSDNLAKDIITHSEKIDADLIVMMTEQESTSLLLGESAGYLVNHSKIPVFSVRPAEVDPDKITVRF
ncbi:MAG: universal stress protein, partial [Bacteroidia bacterium]|nr:universal stress protein [Bacteroidia bacterium]